MNFHPLANIFPLIEGDELVSLAEDIKANGLREPILIVPDDGSILDGRNRFRACALAGVEPRFETWNGKGSRLDLVVSLNMERRHLDATQKALLVAARRRSAHSSHLRSCDASRTYHFRVSPSDCLVSTQYRDQSNQSIQY